MGTRVYMRLVVAVKFAAQKKLIVKSTKFPHCNIPPLYDTKDTVIPS
jgi:hypothetical protein